MRELHVVVSAYLFRFRELYWSTDGQYLPKPRIQVEESMIADCPEPLAKLRKKRASGGHSRDIEDLRILKPVCLELLDFLRGDA
jgi:hypothetical protein